jgi:RNA polymerase sigma-70 factor, ECF subfamily
MTPGLATLALAPRRQPAASCSMPEDARPPSADIAALTSRLARGDEAAWRQFHEGYFDRLLRYLLVVAHGRENMARDALQATFLRAVRHMRRFDDEQVLWSWLTVLARSALVDENRSHQRYQSLLDRFFRRETLAPAPTDHEADARLLGLLEESLATLPAEDRALLQQKYFSREPVRTIANDSGTTEKAVESRLVRIRRHLRQLLLAQLNHEDAQ